MKLKLRLHRNFSLYRVRLHLACSIFAPKVKSMMMMIMMMWLAISWKDNRILPVHSSPQLYTKTDLILEPNFSHLKTWIQWAQWVPVDTLIKNPIHSFWNDVCLQAQASVCGVLLIWQFAVYIWWLIVKVCFLTIVATFKY